MSAVVVSLLLSGVLVSDAAAVVSGAAVVSAAPFESLPPAARLVMAPRWAPAVHHRVAVFTAGGLVSFPLAVSIGQLQHQWAEVGIGFMAAGWLIRAGHYVYSAWAGRMRRPAAKLAVRVR